MLTLSSAHETGSMLETKVHYGSLALLLISTFVPVVKTDERREACTQLWIIFFTGW